MDQHTIQSKLQRVARAFLVAGFAMIAVVVIGTEIQNSSPAHIRSSETSERPTTLLTHSSKPEELARIGDLAARDGSTSQTRTVLSN